jgi:hypothetical protein
VSLPPLRLTDPILLLPALLCWCNKTFSEFMFDAIVNVLNSGDVADIWTCFCMLEYILKLSDTVSLQMYRMDYSLPALLSLMEANQRYYKVTNFCIRWLINLATSSQAVRNWLSSHHELCLWISGWLSTNQKPPRQNSISRSARPLATSDGSHVLQSDRLYKVDPPKVLEEDWMNNTSTPTDPLKSWQKIIM